MRIGFVPLLDAAPLIVAQELGFFREEGLEVSLHRQIGWANIRDKLTYGHLDAGHALLGMPLTSHLGRDSFSEPLVAVMALGCGENAITLSRRLFDAGVRTAADVARYITMTGRRGQLIFGHVFNVSTHHYLIREWLAAGGVDPDRDVRLCVIPPQQMAEHMRGGYLDGFCVGDPWNTLAAIQQCGVPVAATTDLVPDHPGKVLAVTHQWARQKGHTLPALVRAVLRACAFCEDPGRRTELATLLAREKYIDESVELLEESLACDGHFGGGEALRMKRSSARKVCGFHPELAFPSKMHPVWMMREMIRWGHLSAQADVLEIAEHCCQTGPFREAAAELGVACPETDYPPMRLGAGEVLNLERVEREQGVGRGGALEVGVGAHPR